MMNMANITHAQHVSTHPWLALSKGTTASQGCWHMALNSIITLTWKYSEAKSIQVLVVIIQILKCTRDTPSGKVSLNSSDNNISKRRNDLSELDLMTLQDKEVPQNTIQKNPHTF